MEIAVHGDDRIIRLLKLRTRELGETTRQAATAVVVTALKSLRGNTKTANPNHGKDIKVTDVTSMYRPSWKGKGRRFCFTTDGRTETRAPEDWRLCFDKGVVGRRAFYCVDYRSEEKQNKYIVVTTNMQRAKRIVEAFHKKRVMRFRKLARYALGVSMAKLAEGSGLDPVGDGVRKSALQNVSVVVRDSGFSEGEVFISVKDGLDYAAEALKDGPGFVEVAVQRALNQTAGYLEQRLKRAGSLDEKLKAELDSIKG